ncbi:MAG: S41 family peptidase [Treponema sp.]|nr:S41 family peptidase [Treponema sp.]
MFLNQLRQLQHNKNGEPTPDMTSDDVLERLRGPVGTSVTITILRGKNIKFDINLTRALIEVPTIKYSMIEGTSTGYVRIIQFTPETAKRLQDALDSFEKSNYNSLIIDVRDNPGGLMVSAVEVADKFIDEGTIVDVKSRLLFENQKFSAKKENTTVKKGIPIVMLINNGAASASEILAGALKDSHLAYLVGEKTYGKGSVQQVVPLSNTEGIKITMARYYSPSDTNIDKIGIPADLEVKNIEIKPEEEQTYTDLYNSGILPEIATENPNMTENEIAKKAKELAKTYPIEERLLRRLIRVQLPNSASIVYDLDYDNQLQAALDVLKTKDFDSLLKSTKSLKELQEEAKQKDENGKVVATK